MDEGKIKVICKVRPNNAHNRRLNRLRHFNSTSINMRRLKMDVLRKEIYIFPIYQLY